MRNYHCAQGINSRLRKRKVRLRGLQNLYALVLPLLCAASLTQLDAPAQAQKNSESKVAASDIKPEALWDGRKIVPFHALDTPKMVAASEADFLDDGDYVLGVTRNGESRAYPTRFIWWHHVINDEFGKSDDVSKTGVAITYCSVCNTGVAYNPTLHGKRVNLDFYGLYNGIVALCDRETGSAFLQAEGRFVTGPLAGSRLLPVPLLDTTWANWKRLHPDTLVMSPDTPYSKFYSPKGKPEPRGYDRFPAPFFRPTVTRGDKRLPPFEKVLGVVVSEPSASSQEGATERSLYRAYPLAALQGKGCVVNDKLGKTELAVFLDPDTMSAVAVSRVLDGKTLTFEAKKDANGKLAIYDKQTRTRWSLEGLGEDGPLAGKTLERVDNHLSQWYGWVASYPDTSIHGKRGAPLPGDPFETDVAKKP